MRKTYKRLLIHTLIIISTILILVISLNAGFAATRGVNQTAANGSDYYYDNVKSAVGNASAGDTIKIYEGTFNPTSGITLNKNLTFRGEGINKSILDAYGDAVFTISGNNIKLEFYDIHFYRTLHTFYSG